jgi:hypothetical protein
MLLASEAAPAASLPSPLPLSLSPLRGVLGCSCWPALLLLPHLLVEYLGKWDSSLHPPHFISFPFYSASVSLSSARLPPPPFALCASVCFGSSELETAQASEIEKDASGHRPAHLKAEVDSLSLPPLRPPPRRRRSASSCYAPLSTVHAAAYVDCTFLFDFFSIRR